MRDEPLPDGMTPQVSALHKPHQHQNDTPGRIHTEDITRTGSHQRTRGDLADCRSSSFSSAVRASLTGVRVTEAEVARIPATNLRVPRGEFVALWIAAELACDAQTGATSQWYSAGVAATCEWLATAPRIAEVGAYRPACSPATGRTARAHEELIETELLAAERLASREPRPARLARRPGWIEGIVDTLRWAWLHDGAPPLQVDEAR